MKQHKFPEGEFGNRKAIPHPRLKEASVLSTYKLRKLIESPQTKKESLIPLAAELLQRKFGNQGKTLRFNPNTTSQE